MGRIQRELGIKLGNVQICHHEMNDVKRCPDPYFNLKAQLTNGAGSAEWVLYNPSLENLETASIYVPNAQILIT